MRHIAAYLLLVLGGNASPSAKDVSALLGTVGVESDATRLEQLITELEGKSIPDLIALGQTKLYVGGGGGGSASAPSASADAPAASSAPAKEEKAKPKEEEVDALDGGMDMFGGGGGGGGY